MQVFRYLFIALTGVAVTSGAVSADSLWLSTAEGMTEVDVSSGEVVRQHSVADLVTFDVHDASNTVWYVAGSQLFAARDGHVLAGPVDIKGVQDAVVTEVVVDDANHRVWVVRGDEVSVFDASGTELGWWNLATPYGLNDHIVTLQVQATTGLAWIAQPQRIIWLRPDRPWIYGRWWTGMYLIRDIDLVDAGIWVQTENRFDLYDTHLQLHDYAKPADFSVNNGVIAEIDSYRYIRSSMDPTEICADESGVWVGGGYDYFGTGSIDLLMAMRYTLQENVWALAGPDEPYDEFGNPAVATQMSCMDDGSPWMSWYSEVAEFAPNGYADVTRRFEVESPVREFRLVKH